MKGINIQNKIIIKPTVIIKTRTITLNTTKKSLQIAPIILEKKLETKVLKYSVILNPLG